MKKLKLIQTLLLALIGGMSVFMTSAIIFDLFGIRELEGNYVPFVVQANLACGIIYLYAAAMNHKFPRKTYTALIIALAILIITFAAALVYIKNGGIYESQMPKAMTFRTLFTAIMLYISYYLLKRA